MRIVARLGSGFADVLPFMADQLIRDSVRPSIDTYRGANTQIRRDVIEEILRTCVHRFTIKPLRTREGAWSEYAALLPTMLDIGPP
jgi:hypothetical protein